MDFRQIEYFLSVAKTQHMTRAAKELSVAQPALSKTIKTLEHDLGVDLFDRRKNRIYLNTAGHIFLEYAQKLMNSTRDVRRELDEYKKTEWACISIQKNISFEMIYLAILHFSKLYPSVRFEFSPLDDRSQTQLPTYDFWLFSTANPVDTATQKTLLTERIQLGVPFSHPLAQEHSVRLRDLKDEEFLFSVPRKSTLNNIMLMQCELVGFTPKEVVSTGTKDDVAYMLKNGMGIAFTPELSWYYMTKEHGFALVEIEDPVCTRCINVGWKSEGYISKASLLFKEFLLDFVPDEIEKIRKENALSAPKG